MFPFCNICLNSSRSLRSTLTGWFFDSMRLPGQLADVRVQDELSSMFHSTGSILWCATKIREQHSGDLHALIFELPFPPLPELFEPGLLS